MLNVLPRLQVHHKLLLTPANKARDTKAWVDTRESRCLGVPRVKAFLAEVARGGADHNTQDTMDVWQLNGGT